MCALRSSYYAYAHLCAHILSLRIIRLTACRCTVTLMPYALYCYYMFSMLGAHRWLVYVCMCLLCIVLLIVIVCLLFILINHQGLMYSILYYYMHRFYHHSERLYGLYAHATIIMTDFIFLVFNKRTALNTRLQGY